jgi:BirA family biotin operon repressor/biotin-[acetyl-CoA-carboxylase] ligase
VTENYKLAPLAAALAVAETCEQLADVSTQIKWPNDVWIDGRKVSGILVEARPDENPETSWLVIGIGLNTAVPLDQMPTDLQETATTLGLDRSIDALAPLLERLDHWLGSSSEQTIEAWRARDALRGRRISWAAGSGIAEGIDASGNLIVACDDGTTETLAAGEVHLAVD